jgi:hypothetical protein
MGYISMYSVLIPILMGIVLLHKSDRNLLLLFILLIISFGSDILIYFQNSSRVFVWPFYLVAQHVLLSIIFISTSTIKPKKQIIASLMYTYIIYVAIYELYLKENHPNSPDLMVISVFAFTIFSISLFIEIYNKAKVNNLLLYPFFWINTAVLIYFSGNLYLTISYNIFTMQEVYKLYIPIHNSLNTVKNLLFAVAFLVRFINLRSAAKI